MRQLKILLGNDTYLKIKDQLSNNPNSNEKPIIKNEEADKNLFFEVIPLTEGVDLNTQKDLTSVPIQDINFQIVYMIVDKKIELETKLLKEFADWSFLFSR